MSIVRLGSAEKQKRKAAEEQQLAREKRTEEVMHIWEKQVLPDWRVVHKNPGLRKLWWQGVPMSMRGKMWENAVGNPLALSRCNSLAPIVCFSSLTGRKIRTGHASRGPNDHLTQRCSG